MRNSESPAKVALNQYVQRVWVTPMRPQTARSTSLQGIGYTSPPKENRHCVPHNMKVPVIVQSPFKGFGTPRFMHKKVPKTSRKQPKAVQDFIFRMESDSRYRRYKQALIQYER
jgi:hypothetical protein